MTDHNMPPELSLLLLIQYDFLKSTKERFDICVLERF